MARTHDDIIELLGAYALDAVDTEERDEVAAHLATCPRCAAEVAEHREVAAMLANSGGAAPDGVWERIQADLEEQPPPLRMPPPAVPEPAVVSLADRRARRTTWAPITSVAAALVIVALIAVGVLVSRDGSTGGTVDVAAPSLEAVARQVRNDPQARTVDLVSESGDVAAVVTVAPDGAGYLFGNTLPALDPSLTYQLWGIGDTGVISLGVLGEAPGVVAFHLDPGVQTLAITSEAAGGVPASSNPPLVVGSLN